MKQSKIFKIFLIATLLLSTYSFVGGLRVSAATIPPGTYSINNITLINIGPEPRNLQEALKLMNKQSPYNTRGAVVFLCILIKPDW